MEMQKHSETDSNFFGLSEVKQTGTMLTRVVLRRGVTVSVGRLFATSVPRWNVPRSVDGTATVDADTIKAQRIEKSQYEKGLLEARNQRNSLFWKVSSFIFSRFRYWCFSLQGVVVFSLLCLVLVDFGPLWFAT